MADVIAQLYVEILAKTDKLEKDLNELKNEVNDTGKAIDSNLTKNTNKFSKAAGSGTQNLGKFTGAMTNAFGATGKFGNLLGNVAQNLLTGGIIGAGFAAGAAAISYMSEKANEFRESIKKAISQMIILKSETADIKFEVNAESLDATIELLEGAIKSFNSGIAGWDFGLIEDGLRSVLGVSLYLTDEQLKQLTVNEETLKILKDMRAQEEARNILKEQAAKLGLKEKTASDDILRSLEESRKKQEQYKNTLATLTKGTAEYNAIQNALNKEIENYNTLQGVAEKVTKKLISPLEETKKRVQALRDELARARADKFSWDEIFGMKKTPKVSPVAVPDMEAFEVTFSIAEERIIAFTDMVEQSQITLGDVLMTGAEAMAQGIDAAFQTMWQGIKLSAEEAKNPLAQFFVSMANSFIMQVQRMIAQWLALKALMLIGDIFTGGAVSAIANAAGPGGAHGGVFENGKKTKGYAAGGDFMVPSGFPNDSFGLRVQSGERVTVTPSGRVGDESKLLSQVVGRLDALNKNLAIKNMSPIVNVDIDGKQLVKQVTIPNENKLRKAGVDLTSL